MTSNTTTRSILTGLVAATASLVLASTGSAQNNGFSAFPFHIDGAFSGGGEWSDVTPATFLSLPGQTAKPVAPALANSALWAALGTSGAAGEDPTLHLLYDFLPRTNQFAFPGEVVAAVTFPVTLPERPTGDKTLVSVLFQARQNAIGVAGVGGSFFDVFVDLDLDGVGDIPASALGLVGAVGFGSSPLGTFPHLIVELGVGLRIQPNFGTTGGPLPGGGINPTTGLYDPAPEFWGAAGGADGALGDGGLAAAGGLQSASSATLAIQPNGSVNVTAVPEPASSILLLSGLGLLAARRRQTAA